MTRALEAVNIMPYQWWCVLPCRKSFAVLSFKFQEPSSEIKKKGKKDNTDSDAIGPQRLQKMEISKMPAKGEFDTCSNHHGNLKALFLGGGALGGESTLRFPFPSEFQNQKCPRFFIINCSNLQETSFIYFVKGLLLFNAVWGSEEEKEGLKSGGFRCAYGCFPKIVGFPPQIIHFKRDFHYKPSILGYHYFWKHPYFW